MRQFDELEAVSLYCRRCGRAMSVCKRLLLVLPAEELYEYLCTGCGGSLGQKKEPIQDPEIRLS